MLSRARSCRAALALAFALALLAPATASAAGVWSPTGSLTVARASMTTTQLANGSVLAAGGSNRALGPLVPVATADVFNPASGTWSPTSPLGVARVGHTATLLAGPGCGANCGKVLVAGGSGAGGALASVELYDPATGWSPAAPMTTARSGHTATLLLDGRVLVVGGLSGATATTTAELYDPATGTWSPADELADGRTDHTATRLQDGRVLVAAGRGSNLAEIAETELYHPATDNWTTAGTLQVPRSFHSATLLDDGRVLVAGGRGGTPIEMRRSVEIYDPAPGSGGWSAGESMPIARASHVAAKLADGRVVVAGGGAPARAELSSTAVFDPDTGTWRPSGSLAEPRSAMGSLLLTGPGCGVNCGKLLAAGGTRQSNQFFALAELYDPAAATPPGRVADLAAAAASQTALTLTFSAPPSVESFAPPARRFDIRQSPAPITDAASFAAAAPLCGGVCTFDPAAVGEVLSLAVTGLVAGTTYHFALRAIDDDGVTGAVSNAAAATTLPGEAPPGAVADLVARTLSARSAELTFTAPSAGGIASEPSGAFEIRQSNAPIIDDDASFAGALPLCGGTCSFAPPAVGAQLTLTITDLTPSRVYYYALRARDLSGTFGARSNVATVRMPADEIAPGRPRMLAPRRRGRRLTLRFTAVASDRADGPPVQRYVVRQSLRPIRTARAFDRAPALCRPPGCRLVPRRVGQVLTLTVTGLRSGRTYHFAVRARDDAGNLGPRSASLRARVR